MHDEGPGGTDEIARLRRILDLMWEKGALRLSSGDLSIELDPRGPPMPKHEPVSDGGEDIEGDEQRAANEQGNLEKQWSHYWRRYTRSSGAPIPPFPGVEKAKRHLGGH